MHDICDGVYKSITTKTKLRHKLNSNDDVINLDIKNSLKMVFLGILHNNHTWSGMMSLVVFCYQGLLLIQTLSDIEFLEKQYANYSSTNYESRISSPFKSLDTLALLCISAKFL